MYAPEFYVGLDLGKTRDYTAMAVLVSTMQPTGRVTRIPAGFSMAEGQVYDTVPQLEQHFEVLHLDRWRGKLYRDAVPKLERVLAGITARNHAMNQAMNNGRATHPDVTVLVDQTGVGVAVVDDVLRAAGLQVTGITITGGQTPNQDGHDWRVPKADLVGRLEVAFENRRLALPGPDDGVPLVDALVGELGTFRAKKKLATGHETFEHWRETDHDDLVLALAMAVWYAEHRHQVNQGIMETAAVLGEMMEYQTGW